MKATVFAVLAFSSVALAAPNGKKDWCKNGNYHKGEVKADGADCSFGSAHLRNYLLTTI